ncbi:MAG: DUF4352 domain-containing protein [Armatimonadota bacterium]
MQQSRSSPEQLNLPGIGFGLRTPALQPAGGDASTAATVLGGTGRPLSVKQVAVAVGAVLLVVLGILFYAGYRPRFGGGGAGAQLPVLGVIGEQVTIGDTLLGVASTGVPESVNGREAQGQYLAVVIVIGNTGTDTFTLNEGSFGLTDGRNGGRHQPVLMAYGTPEELHAGQFHKTFQLGSKEVIAAVAIFDVPTSDTEPRLLVRDMARSGNDFTGAIDLTREAEQPEESESPPPSGIRPL